MNASASAAKFNRFDEEALKRGVASVTHPPTRALLVLTVTIEPLEGVG